MVRWFRIVMFELVELAADMMHNSMLSVFRVVNNSVLFMGFAKKSSIPAARQRSRSPFKALAGR